MNRETMKKLDAAGWPAFGLGYGRWTRVSRRGGVPVGGQLHSVPTLLAHAGEWVFVTLAGSVYSSDLDLLVGDLPRERTLPVRAAAQ
jgi:hypothetical protein